MKTVRTNKSMSMGNPLSNGMSRNAFTLVELLVVITIVMLLVGLVSVGSQAALNAARKAEEISAARTLITAYLATAVENNGRYLAAYDRSVGEVVLDDGQVVGGPAANRYPYRLHPYLGNTFEGSVLLDKNRSQIDTTSHYEVSLHPAFGINYIFVGGDVQSDGSISHHAECITTFGRASSSPLVFATAGMEGEDGETIEGFNLLEPPQVFGPAWASVAWSEDASPSQYGGLHARHGDKVIAAFLDGSVRQLTVEELRDMRLWSFRAAEENDPDYTVTRTNTGRRGRG